MNKYYPNVYGSIREMDLDSKTCVVRATCEGTGYRRGDMFVVKYVLEKEVYYKKCFVEDECCRVSFYEIIQEDKSITIEIIEDKIGIQPERPWDRR